MAWFRDYLFSINSYIEMWDSERKFNSHYLPPTRVYMGVDCVEMAGALGYEAPFTARLLA